jgi:uncharacterized protein YndB with AHSA1/START domain
MQTDNAPFVIERTLNAPVDKVWRALTDRDEMKKWYFDLDAFKPEVGFTFQFAGQGHKGEKYMHLCEIKEVIPQQKLSYSWEYQGLQGSSVVTFELSPEGNKTKIKLTHTGLETFPKDNSDFAKESFSAGWTELIGVLLPKYLENQ